QDATITTNPPTDILQTDELGRFAFENIKTGSYTLRIEKLGFETKIENLAVIQDNPVNPVIRLISDSLANNPPLAATAPIPTDGAKDLGTSVSLSWTASDPDGDPLRYDLRLLNFDQSQSALIAQDLTVPEFEVTDLEYGKLYFWQVIVKDGSADAVNGTLWSFETAPFPDHRFLFSRVNDGKYDIFSSDELGNAIQLTNNLVNNWRPRMNPDRSKIAFLSNSGLETHIFTMNRDGSDAQQITSISVNGDNIFDLDFAWSPDGEELLYMNGNKLYKVDHDGTGTELFAEAPNGFTYAECDWTLIDNKIIARLVGDNLYNSIIYLYDADGNLVQPLLTDIPGSTGGPMFSTVGTGMVYTQDISGYEVPDGRQLDARILTRDLNGFVPLDLSGDKVDGTNDLDPRFSPDGAWIIFTNTNNDGISQKDIYRMKVDGTDRELLFENAEMPDWK
ncbi:MAG: hypothetical protein AAF573_21530, partial [Bacteroidota bacterium]